MDAAARCCTAGEEALLDDVGHGGATGSSRPLHDPLVERNNPDRNDCFDDGYLDLSLCTENASSLLLFPWQPARLKKASARIRPVPEASQATGDFLLARRSSP